MRLHALSGAVMAGFASQAQGVVMRGTDHGDAARRPSCRGNDVRRSSMAKMTAPAPFEAQTARFDVPGASDATVVACIHVSATAIYWLWKCQVQRLSGCRVFAWPFVPCENLLDDPGDELRARGIAAGPGHRVPR